jgi:hypothetical protein
MKFPYTIRIIRIIRIIRRWAAGPGLSPEQPERLLAAVMADITSPRNLNSAGRHRSCPRVVRRVRHNSYPVKKPGDTGTRHHGLPAIRLVNLRPQPAMINLGSVALMKGVAYASARSSTSILGRRHFGRSSRLRPQPLPGSLHVPGEPGMILRSGYVLFTSS